MTIWATTRKKPFKTASLETKKSKIQHKHYQTIGLSLAILTSIALQPIKAQTLPQPTITPLEERAAYYVEFRNDIMSIESTSVTDASVTRDAHQRLASHDPALLSSGWMAYAALVAADTPEFANALKAQFDEGKKRKRKKKKDQISKRDAFIETLRADPGSARKLEGAEAAIEAIMNMAASDATKINAVGESYIANAYSLQNQGWAKRKIRQNGSERVNSAESFSSSRARAGAPILPASVEGGVKMPGLSATDYTWSPNWSSSSTTPRHAHNSAAVMNKILVLAARYAVDEISQPIVDGYAKSVNGRRCLNNAKLNFNQCIAATRTPYEEAFCIGEHGLNDVSGCIGWVASAGAGG